MNIPNQYNLKNKSQGFKIAVILDFKQSYNYRTLVKVDMHLHSLQVGLLWVISALLI